MQDKTENFINKAKQIHGDKYDYSKVEYVNNHTKVCIICPSMVSFGKNQGIIYLNMGAQCAVKRIVIENNH